MKPIYTPKGKAKEYGDLAINIYTGCQHRCYYCFAPNVLHREREAFHSVVMPRINIVEETRKQLEREQITGQLIHLCFTCDPYPTDIDSSATREIIMLLKEHGNHVQILTKGNGSRDFDLLDGEDWFGVSISCDHPLEIVAEPGAVYVPTRLNQIIRAKELGIKTWVSFEPVIDADDVLQIIEEYCRYFDRVKIGKLNYYPSKINWADFGWKAKALCQSLGLDYYIKDSLLAEMRKANECSV